MTAPDIASAALLERQYAEALDLVLRFRAASVALVQRHLLIDYRDAEVLLGRMSRETTLVRRMPNGLYMFVGEVIGGELQALHGFAQEVLAALESGQVDPDRLRDAAIRFGIPQTVEATGATAT